MLVWVDSFGFVQVRPFGSDLKSSQKFPKYRQVVYQNFPAPNDLQNSLNWRDKSPNMATLDWPRVLKERKKKKAKRKIKNKNKIVMLNSISNRSNGREQQRDFDRSLSMGYTTSSLLVILMYVKTTE